MRAATLGRGAAALVLFATLAPAQAPASTPSTQVTANERYVYVVRGETLYQFDADTLALKRTTQIPDSGAPVLELSQGKISVRLEEDAIGSSTLPRTAACGSKTGSQTASSS